MTIDYFNVLCIATFLTRFTTKNKNREVYLRHCVAFHKQLTFRLKVSLVVVRARRSKYGYWPFGSCPD